ncbi:MAG: hypothetical protein AAF394_03660 [Planctomycetota bacterium]
MRAEKGADEKDAAPQDFFGANPMDQRRPVLWSHSQSVFWPFVEATDD